MATLTFRERVTDGREALRKFQRQLARFGLGDLHTAWVREYQERGAVHYHFLWEREGLEERGFLAETQSMPTRKKGKFRTLVRGQFERMVIFAWTLAVGDKSPEFEAFQHGGIVEILRTGDGASRYFGSYLSKEKQKQAPADDPAAGRWWWIHPDAMPVPVGSGHMVSWDKPIPLTILFNKDDHAYQVTGIDLPVTPSRATREAAAQYVRATRQ